MTLPTIDELPPIPTGYSRDQDDLMRVALIPADDRDVRHRAVELLIADERCRNEVPSDKSDWDEWRKAILDITSIPARTPGGIAWKIATALEFWKDEEKWEWWRHLLNSALGDAIDLERARSSRAIDDLAVVLVQHYENLIERHNALSEDTEENIAARERLCAAWVSISRWLLPEVPAKTHQGIAAKLRVYRHETEAGRATDDRDKRLFDSLYADLERLGREHQP